MYSEYVGGNHDNHGDVEGEQRPKNTKMTVFHFTSTEKN